MLTFHGANFDILIGLSAPVVAVLYARHAIDARAALIWNLVGIASLANVVVRNVLMSPAIHLISTEVPNSAIGSFPYSFIPTLIVPLALCCTCSRSALCRPFAIRSAEAVDVPGARRRRQLSRRERRLRRRLKCMNHQRRGLDATKREVSHQCRYLGSRRRGCERQRPAREAAGAAGRPAYRRRHRSTRDRLRAFAATEIRSLATSAFTSSPSSTPGGSSGRPAFLGTVRRTRFHRHSCATPHGGLGNEHPGRCPLVLPRRRWTYVAFHVFGLSDFITALVTGLSLTLASGDARMRTIATFPLALSPSSAWDYPARLI